MSPFERAWGSLADWEAECQSGIEEGRLDARDMPVVVMALRRWHSQEVWRYFAHVRFRPMTVTKRTFGFPPKADVGLL